MKDFKEFAKELDLLNSNYQVRHQHETDGNYLYVYGKSMAMAYVRIDLDLIRFKFYSDITLDCYDVEFISEVNNRVLEGYC